MDRRDFLKTTACTIGLAAISAGASSFNIPELANPEDPESGFLNDAIHGMTEKTCKKDENLTILSQTNTRYIIKYDFSLHGKTWKVPANSILVFAGGSINNGMLECNNTIVESSPIKIFGSNILIQGRLNNERLFFNWFGAMGDGETDDTDAIQKAIDTAATTGVAEITGTDGLYLITKTINIIPRTGLNKYIIGIRGRVNTYPSINRGLRFYANTGAAAFEIINAFSVTLENFGIFTDENLSNPSSVGIFAGRGNQFDPQINAKNITIDIQRTNKKSINGGYGNIGLWTKDTECSIWENCRIEAGLAYAGTSDAMLEISSCNSKNIPIDIRKTYKYGPSYFNDQILFKKTSNTNLSFINCHFESWGGDNPAIYLKGASFYNFISCYVAGLDLRNGNTSHAIECDYASTCIFNIECDNYKSAIFIRGSYMNNIIRFYGVSNSTRTPMIYLKDKNNAYVYDNIFNLNFGNSPILKVLSGKNTISFRNNTFVSQSVINAIDYENKNLYDELALIGFNSTCSFHFLDGSILRPLPKVILYGNSIPSKEQMKNKASGSVYRDNKNNNTFWWNGSNFRDDRGFESCGTTGVTLKHLGTTAERKTFGMNSGLKGFDYYDTDLNMPIWWNGTAWIDANGTKV
jgi:hypothetical protein